MPLVPRFTLAQNEAAVLLTVRVPYVRVSDAEIVVDGSELSFYCKPYLLRLTLPGELVDDERVKATYDADDQHGTMVISVPKATPGCVFPDLDMVTKLLQPRAAMPQRPSTSGSNSASAAAVDIDLSHVVATRADDEDDAGEGNASEESLHKQLQSLSLSGDAGPLPAPSTRPGGGRRPLIEVISSDMADGGTVAAPSIVVNNSTAASELHDTADDTPAENSAAGLEQAATPAVLPSLSSSSSSSSSSAPHYGFNRAYRGVFAGLKEDLPDVVDLPDPDVTNEGQRSLLRVLDEEGRWDPYRYASDASEEVEAEDPIYQEAVGMTPWWRSESSRACAASASAGAATAIASPAPLSAPDTSGSSCSDSGGWQWTEQEGEEMRQLPNKEFLVDGELIGGAKHTAVAALAPDLLLPNRPEAQRILTCLVPILAAYAYDHRTTGGDVSCESAWTIATLAPPLGWLDDEMSHPTAATGENDGGNGDYSDTIDSAGAARPLISVVSDSTAVAVDASSALTSNRGDGIGLTAISSKRVDSTTTRESHGIASNSATDSSPASSLATHLSLLPRLHSACCAFIRRVLCYPYLRRWDLAVLALNDARAILAGGRRPVLRALLAVRRILRGDDQRYLLGTVWLDDACVWAQSVPDGCLGAVAEGIAAILPAASKSAKESSSSSHCTRLPLELAALQVTPASPAFALWQLERIQAEGPDAVAVGGSQEEEEEEGDDEEEDE